MDFKRFMQAVRRNKVLVILACLVGLGLGAAYTVLRPPLLTSSAQVDLPSSKFIQTQALSCHERPGPDAGVGTAGRDGAGGDAARAR